MWRNSRHPENIADMKQAMADAGAESLTPETKALIGGTLALVALQGGPGNEAVIGNVSTAVIESANNLGVTFLAAAGTIALIDGTIGVGTSLLHHKFRPALNVAKDRYGRKAPEKSVENANSKSKVKRALGMTVLGTTMGSFFTIGLYDYRDGGKTLTQNLKTGAVSTALTATAGATFVTAVHGVATGIEAGTGQTGFVENAANFLKVVIPAGIVGFLALKYSKNKINTHRETRVRVNASAQHESLNPPLPNVS